MKGESTGNCLLLALLLMVFVLDGTSHSFGVQAFQSSQSLSSFSHSHGTRLLSQRHRTPGWVRVQVGIQTGSKAHLLVMASDWNNDASTNGKRSKRQRLKASVKKLISYPKRKIDKLRRKDEDETLEEPQMRHVVQPEFTNGEAILNGEGIGVNGDTTSFSSPRVSWAKNNNSVHEVNGATLVASPTVESVTNSAPSTELRSATSNAVDLSGKWELIVSEDFKTDYDRYLKLLGQPSLVRSVALSIIGMTSEETLQSEQGRELKIVGRNVRGNWERTLKASSEDNPLVVPIVTADNEIVQSECWWEQDGSIHRSWLRGVEKYGGGDFESKRHLEDDGDTLVCESTFHPFDESKPKASVTWKFRRVEEVSP